jgi:uncharacterized protein
VVASQGLNAGLQARGAPSGHGVLNGVAPRRLERLPIVRADGVLVRLATTRLSRLLGLALTDLGEAEPGLLIPSCRSVHTFGMRFALDVAFLDARGAVISRRHHVGPRRVVADRRASAVLEVPARGRGRWRPAPRDQASLLRVDLTDHEPAALRLPRRGRESIDPVRRVVVGVQNDAFELRVGRGHPLVA